MDTRPEESADSEDPKTPLVHTVSFYRNMTRQVTAPLSHLRSHD